MPQKTICSFYDILLSANLQRFYLVPYSFEKKEIILSLMLRLSTKRISCDYNYATFRLPWVHSLHCPSRNFFLFFRSPSKNFFLFFDESFLNGPGSEPIPDKRKVAQLKRQQFLSLDSQSISLFSVPA